MDTMIYITGVGTCRQVPVKIETPKAVKTVIKAEELALAALSAALKQIRNLELETGIVFGIDNAIDRCKEEFFKGLLAEGPIGASPLLFPYTSHNAITAQATIAFGIKGEDITITSGALSFLKAIEYGFELLHRGVMRSVIAGGVSENEAMVVVMESLTPDEAQRKRGAGISLKEVTGYDAKLGIGNWKLGIKNPLPRDEVEIKSIEDSFRVVEDFIKGKSELTTENWILQVKA